MVFKGNGYKTQPVLTDISLLPLATSLRYWPAWLAGLGYSRRKYNQLYQTKC